MYTKSEMNRIDFLGKVTTNKVKIQLSGSA